MTTIGIIALALTSIYFAYKNAKGRRGERFLEEEVRKTTHAYYMLQIGMDEIQTGYEQEVLSFDEQLDVLHNRCEAYRLENEELQAHLEKHDRECLPNSFDASWRPHVTTDESIDPPLYIGQE